MSVQELRPPVVWAHRGFNRAAPENTLAAFRLAKKAGLRAWELDIALTSDGELIVIHDDTVDRTTNGSGIVADMTAGELRNLDAGSWFASEFSGERLPMLDEVLRLAGPATTVNIEVKISAWREDPGIGLEAPLLDLVEDTGMRDSVVISSFDPRILTRLRSLDPHIPLAALTLEGVDLDLLRDIADRLEIWSWHPYILDATPSLVTEFQARGIRVFPYTVRDETAAREARHTGADGYFADLPFLENKKT